MTRKEWDLTEKKWRRTLRRRERRHRRSCAKHTCEQHLRKPGYAELLRQNIETLERL